MLEKLAFDLVVDLLNNDEFYVNGKKSKIFSKKEYYSEKRKDNIKFDITVETYLKNADQYSLLTIIECKNLNKPVSVDDVEEFESKIRQIGEHNTKGVMISSSCFQEGAFNLAASLGIGIIRITSNNKYEWINYRKEKTLVGMSQQDPAKQFLEKMLPEQKFIVHANSKAFNNFADLLLELEIIDYYRSKEKFINVPFVSDERIDEIISRLAKYNVYDGVLLDTEKLCRLLCAKYPVEFQFEDVLPNRVLGKIEFQPPRVYVTKSLKSDLHR